MLIPHGRTPPIGRTVTPPSVQPGGDRNCQGFSEVSRSRVGVPRRDTEGEVATVNIAVTRNCR